MSAVPSPPATPSGLTPNLYLTPQLEKRPDGLAPSLLDLSNTTAVNDGSVVSKSYRTSSAFLKATPKDDSRELQTIVDSITIALEHMTDRDKCSKDLCDLTFEPQGCLWTLAFNPGITNDFELHVVCKACADVNQHNAYVVDTMLVSKSGRAQQTDPGFKEAMATFDFAALQIRKAIVKLEFPDFPEGCKGRPFRDLYQLNARVSKKSDSVCVLYSDNGYTHLSYT